MTTAGAVMKRSKYQRLADHLWPDGMDMVAPAYGEGPWSTVAWCAGLTVHLHRTKRDARSSLAAIDHVACGHGCWKDHELVRLLGGAFVHEKNPEREAGRVSHFLTCKTCAWVYSGEASSAAMKRRYPREI